MQQAEPDQAPGLVMILGTMQRSGTNFLCDALSSHQDCTQAHGIYEDGVLRNAAPLADFIAGVTRWWRPTWDPDGALSHAFGAGLYRSCEDFLIGLAEPEQLPGKRYVVTKTPSVANLPLVRNLPRTKVIVLVRDGRAVVQSGMKSFGWGFEDAMLRWSAAGRIVSAARRDGIDFHLVRYEDLLTRPRETLEGVFSYLGLDPARYDYDRVEQLPVRGSSSFRGDKADVHWSAVARDQGFDPLARFADWPQWRLYSFSMLAGEVARDLGYDVPPLAAAPLRWRLWSVLERLRVGLFSAYDRHLGWRIRG